MFKRIIYLILFLSQSGLLFANEQKIASLSLTTAKGIHTTASNHTNTPPSADDFITIDFSTNYAYVRSMNDKTDSNALPNAHTYHFLNENVLSNTFVQKILNFFKSQSIYLLNCIWLI